MSARVMRRRAAAGSGRLFVPMGTISTHRAACLPFPARRTFRTSLVQRADGQAEESEQDKNIREGVLRGFDRMTSLERMEVEGRATLPDGKNGVTLTLQGSGKILRVKVDEGAAGNVADVEKLFVAASQNARQKIADHINHLLGGGQ